MSKTPTGTEKGAGTVKGTGTPRHPATEILHNGRNPAAQRGSSSIPPTAGRPSCFRRSMRSKTTSNQPFKYGRHGTPTTAALEDALAGSTAASGRC